MLHSQISTFNSPYYYFYRQFIVLYPLYPFPFTYIHDFTMSPSFYEKKRNKKITKIEWTRYRPCAERQMEVGKKITPKIDSTLLYTHILYPEYRCPLMRIFNRQMSFFLYVHTVKIVNFIRHSFAISFTLDTTNTVYILIRCESPWQKKKFE